MIPRNPWKPLSIQAPFECPYFIVREDIVSYNGRPARQYNSVRMKVHGVSILPIDAEGWTVLVGQHRYVLGCHTWELPGGGMPVESNALKTAENELREETGIVADHWMKLLEVPVAPGTIDEFSTAFVAWGLRTATPHPDPDEDLATWRLPFSDAVQMALRGEIGHISSVAALLNLHVRLTMRDLPAELARLLNTT